MILKTSAIKLIIIFENKMEYKYIGNRIKVKTITIPKECTSIADNGCYHCVNLHTVIFEEGSRCEHIGYSAFAHCLKLKNIILPKSLKTIGNMAFHDTGLTSIIIPDSVVSIGNAAFTDCTWLERVELPHNNITLGFKPFGGAQVYYKQVEDDWKVILRMLL